MKNLKTIVIRIFIISAIAINVVQSLKRNVALVCYPWDRYYSTLSLNRSLSHCWYCWKSRLIFSVHFWPSKLVARVLN